MYTMFYVNCNSVKLGKMKEGIAYNSKPNMIFKAVLLKRIEILTIMVLNLLYKKVIFHIQ